MHYPWNAFSTTGRDTVSSKIFSRRFYYVELKNFQNWGKGAGPDEGWMRLI